jgi:hypothetical protein
LPELAAANTEERARQAATLVQRAMVIAENNVGSAIGFGARCRRHSATAPRI